MGKQSSKKYYDKNKDEINQKKKEYYQKNKEKVLKRCKQYYLDNQEKIKERDKQYCKNNREKINKRKREYLKTKRGKEINRRRRQKRRALKKNVIEEFTLDEWLKMKNDTKGICPLCKQFVGINNITLDHINAISIVKHGHIYTIKDIQPLCGICNSKKGIKVTK